MAAQLRHQDGIHGTTAGHRHLPPGRHLAGKHAPFSQPGGQRGVKKGGPMGGVILAAHQREQDRRQVEHPTLLAQGSGALALVGSVDRVIFLGVQVDDASADDVMAQLLVLESQDPDRDIIMYINSPGGSFTSMTAIYDTMQFVRPHIQTVCLGQAASAAAVLLAAGSPGRRLARSTILTWICH